MEIRDDQRQMRGIDLLPHNQVGYHRKSKSQTKLCQTYKYLEWTVTKQVPVLVSSVALSISTSTWPQRFNPGRTQHYSEDKRAGLLVRSRPIVHYKGSRTLDQMVCCAYMLGCQVSWILIFSFMQELWGSCSLSGPSHISNTTHFTTEKSFLTPIKLIQKPQGRFKWPRMHSYPGMWIIE